MKPKVPKIEKPVTPEKPKEPPASQRVALRPQGRESFVSAGRIGPARTRKATLLG